MEGGNPAAKIVDRETRRAIYAQMKLAAREQTTKNFKRMIKTRADFDRWDGTVLRSIQPDALQYARVEWPKFYNNSGKFNGFEKGWDELYRIYHHRPSFFDLAIWQRVGGEDVLQGLCLGRPSRGKTHLSLHWIERSFAPTYMKGGILDPVIDCALQYAKLLECERILIKNPIDSTLYDRYGFRPCKVPNTRGDYLSKELK